MYDYNMILERYDEEIFSKLENLGYKRLSHEPETSEYIQVFLKFFIGLRKIELKEGTWLNNVVNFRGNTDLFLENCYQPQSEGRLLKSLDSIITYSSPLSAEQENLLGNLGYLAITTDFGKFLTVSPRDGIYALGNSYEDLIGLFDPECYVEHTRFTNSIIDLENYDKKN